MSEPTRQLNIRIPELLHQELTGIAAEDRRSLTQTIIIALQEWCAVRELGEKK